MPVTSESTSRLRAVTHWVCRSCRWHRFDNGIDRVTLSFTSPGTEAAFAHSHMERLIVCTPYLAALSIFHFATVLAAYKPWDTAQYATLEAFRLSRWQIGINASATLFVAIALTLSRVLARRGVFGIFALEMAIVVIVIVLGLCLAITPKHYIARAFGNEDPSSVWGIDLGGTDAGMLIGINVFNTALHIFLPIRWKVLLLMEAVIVPSYVLPAFILGSPHMRMAPNNSIGLAIIVILTAVGKRAFECLERRLFMGLISEKSIRFEAEYQLSQARSQLPPLVEDNDTNDAISLGGSSSALVVVGEDDVINFEKIRTIGLREQWLVDSEEVRALEGVVLGEGGFGIVLKGIYQGVPCAIKAPKARACGINRGSSATIGLCNELRILRRLRHPNIVILYGAVLLENGRNLSLIMEFVDGTPLGRFILGLGTSSGHDAEGEKDDLVRVTLLVDIACALRFVHSRQPAIVHSDIKDSNILVEHHQREADGRRQRAKLLDFGLSRIISGNAKPMGGTLRWMAPEIRSGQQRFPDKAADVYSFGLLVFFVATGRYPNTVQSMLLGRSRSLALQWPGDEDGLAGRCRPLSEQCTQTTADLRPAMQDVHNTLNCLMEEVAGQLSPVPDDAPRCGLAHPAHHATPSGTRLASLKWLLHLWNHEMPSGSCCAVHAAIPSLDATRRELIRTACHDLSPVEVNGQCNVCKLLIVDHSDDPDPNALVCDLCGGGMASAAWRPQGAQL